MANTKFYFATYEIEGEPGFGRMDTSKSFDEIYEEAIVEYIELKEPVVEYDDSRWHFGSPSHEGSLHFGKFGKVFSDEQRSFDQEVGDFVELEATATDADYSFFVIDTENNLIIFNSTHRVRHRNFLKHFQKGFEKKLSGNLSIKFELLKEDRSLSELVEEYPVKRFKAELRPTNPGPDKEFEDLDEDMQEMLVDRLGIDARRLDEEGINISQDFLSQVKSMAESDYGEEWTVTIREETGELKVVSSGDRPESVEKEVETLAELKSKAQELVSKGTQYL